MKHLQSSISLPAVAGLLLLFGATTVGVPAQAQDDPEQPVLPDIAPQVVEIRGQLEISLPSLQRQPLIGFNPPPPVAVIPPDRRPLVESYKQESIDLPPSPLQPPDPPSVASLISRAPRNGLLESAVGRYFSRVIRFRTEWPATEPTAVYSKFDYAGSDGHQPFDNNPEAQASYDALDALVGLEYVGRAAAIGLEVDGFLNQYALFAAEPDAGATFLDDDPPDREGRGGGIAAWLRTQAESVVDVDARLRYGNALYETLALNDPSASPDAAAFFERSEDVIEAEAALSLPFPTGQMIEADGRFTGIGFDDESVAQTIRTVDAGAGVRLAFRRGLELTAKARVLSFAAEQHAGRNGTDGADDGTYPSIEFAANLYPAEGVRFYVENRPHAEQHTLASLYRESPYLVDQPVVQPTVYTIDARGGAHLVRGAFEANLYAGYQTAPNFLFYQRAGTNDAGGLSAAVMSTFEEAEILVFGGDASVNLPAGLNAAVAVAARDGELVDSGIDIPYFGSVLGSASLSHSFADGRGFLQVTGRYESSRFVDLAQSRELGDYFDLDVEGSYNFSSSLGMLVRLANLSSGYLERWENYEQSPFVVMAGARVNW